MSVPILPRQEIALRPRHEYAWPLMNTSAFIREQSYKVPLNEHPTCRESTRLGAQPLGSRFGRNDALAYGLARSLAFKSPPPHQSKESITYKKASPKRLAFFFVTVAVFVAVVETFVLASTG